MLPRTRKWFSLSRKSKRSDDTQTSDQTDASAMSELAESLQKEIQGLSVEIKTLKSEREQLFSDIHHIMLSKSQALDGIVTDPPAILSTSPPTLKRHRSTQSLWFPVVPPIPESEILPEVEMGLFGPRSRASSLNGESRSATTITRSDTSASSPSTPNHRRPMRSASDGAPVKNLEVYASPTRTAWRTVNRRGEPIRA